MNNLGLKENEYISQNGLREFFKDDILNNNN